MSVRPSVRKEQLGSHWPDVLGFDILIFFFSKFFNKIKFSLKSDKNNVYFTRGPTYIFEHIPLSSSENEKYFRP